LDSFDRSFKSFSTAKFRSFEGLFTRLFVLFVTPAVHLSRSPGSLSTPAAETTGGHPCTTATTTDEPTDRTSHKKIKGAGSFRDPRRMTKAIEGLLAIVPLSSAEGQG
jgi:hypothetical protein